MKVKTNPMYYLRKQHSNLRKPMACQTAILQGHAKLHAVFQLLHEKHQVRVQIKVNPNSVPCIPTSQQSA